MNATVRPPVLLLDVERAGVNFMKCHQWLEEAHESTNEPGLRRLIEETIDELWDLGSAEGELGDLVLGALNSVAAALDVDTLLQRIDRAGPKLRS